jgi:hypothetical protein
MPFASSGATIRRITTQHFVVFYRPSDGRILHLHSVQVLEGGRHVSRTEAEEEAERRAKEYIVGFSQCKRLYVTELPAGGAFRVNVKDETLVALEGETPAHALSRRPSR